MLTDIQQLRELLEQNKHILLIFGLEKSDDAIASALAWKLFLEKQQKQVDIASAEFKAPRHLRFLPGLEEIKPRLSDLQKFILKVDVSKTKIETVSYDVKDDWLSIYLTPKQGTITKENLRTAQSSFKYGLIMTLGVRDLDSLGDIFFHNTDLFYRAPIVNFDFHPDNERFGQVNMVDTTAASVAEVVFKTMEQLGGAYLDEQAATCLLTGLISQTYSFRLPNITPIALNAAGKLMNLGAEREKIIQHLYRTRSLATLKLWGKALSNLQSMKDIGLVWTSITREDFIRSGANEEDLKGAASELIGNTPEAKIILILNEPIQPEESNTIHGFLLADKQHDALELTRPFDPIGNKKTSFFSIKNKTLHEAEEEAIEIIKSCLISKP